MIPLMHFAVSGVDLPLYVPPLVGFALALLTSAAGISGAFLLLPFQVTVLGFSSPAVSPTNLIFNIVATPGGIYRYTKEGRMAWALAGALVAGTLPGVFLGALARLRYLPDARSFKLFVAGVLLYLGVRLLWQRGPGRAKPATAARVKTVAFAAGRIEYEFSKDRFAFNPAAVTALALVVGLVGGIYGIGGGAIIAPFLVAVFGLPVYTIAGAALLSTLSTSLAGVVVFQWLGHSADWPLGLLFGLGGLAGSYAGARLQKHLPERWIRLFLGALVMVLAAVYIGQYFF